MTQIVWRIATDTPDYEASDAAGRGAEITGGRWNERGVPVIYASMSRALACLETVVHFNAGGLPYNRYLVSVDIPDAVWQAALQTSADQLPVGWDAEPAGRVSIGLGTAWLLARTTALLLVPSIIVPEEWNVLINPLHPDSGTILIQKVRKWIFDPRLKAPS